MRSDLISEMQNVDGEFIIDRYPLIPKSSNGNICECRISLGGIGFIGVNCPGCIISPDIYNTDIKIVCNVRVYITELDTYVYTPGYYTKKIFHDTSFCISTTLDHGNILYIYRYMSNKIVINKQITATQLIDYVITKQNGVTSIMHVIKDMVGRPIPDVFNSIIYYTNFCSSDHGMLYILYGDKIVCKSRSVRGCTDDDYIFEILVCIICCEFYPIMHRMYPNSSIDRSKFIDILTEVDRMLIMHDLIKICNTCDVCKKIFEAKYGTSHAYTYPDIMWDVLAMMRYHTLRCVTNYMPVYNSDMLRIGQLVAPNYSGDVEHDRFDAIYGAKHSPLYLTKIDNFGKTKTKVIYKGPCTSYVYEPITTKFILIKYSPDRYCSDTISLTIFPYIPRLATSSAP